MTIVLRIQLKGLPEEYHKEVETIKGRLNMKQVEFTKEMSKDIHDIHKDVALRAFTMRDTFDILTWHL